MREADLKKHLAGIEEATKSKDTAKDSSAGSQAQAVKPVAGEDKGKHAAKAAAPAPTGKSVMTPDGLHEDFVLTQALNQLKGLPVQNQPPEQKIATAKK